MRGVQRSREASNVRTLVSEATWRRVRDQVVVGARHRCELCGGVGRRAPGLGSTGDLHAHELWRYRDDDRLQVLERIQCLCPDCHQAVHWWFPRPPAPGGKFLGPFLAMVEMIEAAGWPAGELEAHHREVLRRYEQRNERPGWSLDLTAASLYGLDLGVLDPARRLAFHPASRMAQQVRAQARRDETRQEEPGSRRLDSTARQLTVAVGVDPAAFPRTGGEGIFFMINGPGQSGKRWSSAGNENAPHGARFADGRPVAAAPRAAAAPDADRPALEIVPPA